MAPTKRKRGERSSFDAGESRPSPHRPGNTNLGQYDRGDMRDPGGRWPSRGAQGGQGAGRGRRIEGRDGNVNRNTTTTNATPNPNSMSPPRPSSATQPPTPVTDAPSEEPKADPAPFDYEFITADRISSWDTGSRQEVVDAGSQALAEENTSDLAIIFQELIRAALNTRLEAADAGSCVWEILEPFKSSDAPSTYDAETLFIDTLSIVCEAEPGLYEPGKFSTALRPFTVATGVSPSSLRQKLDALLLQNLGLTRDTFIRVGIRQATHLLYRQANYNLLREETEGYSKLVTELFTISGSEPPTASVVEDAFEKVKGLIGTFDLDVGRVLDITLDVFAAVLIKHYRFFIKLLRVSSWWPRNSESENGGIARCAGLPSWALPTSAGFMPTEEDDELSRQERSIRDTEFWARAREVGLNAFFELGGRQVVSPEAKQRIFNGEANDAELDADRQWIEGTGTYPPLGNRTAAQLLGFKLRFYTSQARDKTDILPANLIYLAALLIKIGFLSLRDLYPHLWPLDEDMEKVREARMKELEEKERQNRPGGAANALMLAGALVDDTLPNGGRTRETTATKAEPVAKTTTEVEDSEKLDEPMDQKVQLLICLLTIGAIPESLFILGRFPWLPEAYPELLDLIHRILHHSIKDVYDMSRPISDQEVECSTKQVADPDQSGVPKGQVRSMQTPVRKQLRWPFPDKVDTNEGNSYRFYWDEWADNIPVCQNVDDVFTLCGTLLNYSGVCIGRDASLLSKFARIGAQSLATDNSKQNLDRWQDLLKRLLVPALSLTKSNTHVVNEIYDMLRYYPVSVRYLIYAEWFEGQTSRLPAMKTAFARARLETLGTMKRISMTNITTMARSLAKTAYASPGIVFSVALSQIEAYTNLTEVVVECAKYFSDLGYDVLVWSLMSSLGGKDRNRNNSEYALLPSRWLLALSRFSGKVFRRYSIMNLSPILQYVNDQLYRGNSTDLVILKELIAQMAGVVPDTDFTDAQLTAMTGGKVLRKQTLINLQDKRYESVKTARRLMKALTETKLAGQLLISIAQHRQSAIYSISDDEAHIKLLATMIDDTQLILFQYLDLLCSNLNADEFDSHVPGIPELLTDFGLDPSLAFMIGRAGLAERMSNIASPALNGATEALAALPEPSPAKIDSDGDTGMELETEEQANGIVGTDAEPEHANGVVITKEEDVQIAELKESTPPPVTTTELASSSANVFHDVIAPIIDTVRALQPEDSWKAISPEFYVTFWTAALPDLSIPKDSYEKEILRIADEQKVVMKDRSDMTRAGMARKEEIKKTLDETRAALISEFGKQVGAYRQKRSRLLKGKSVWFESSAKPDVVSDAILERCLIPRLLLSPSDADFCFKMIKFLHDNSTPNFRTLSLYGRLFRANRLRSIIFACTVREAENLGRFLRLVLAEFARWHADAAVYEKEAWGVNKNLPGFAKALEPDGKPKALFEYDAKQGLGFKALLLTWHRALNTALRDCLDGNEWMHIRNAITILKSVAEVFPAIDFMGNGFMKQLEVITKREKDVREDLSLTGNAVLVQLKKKSSSWVMVQAFGSNVAGQANGSAKATPPPKNSTLKPTAPEFRPQSQASSLGESTPKHLSTAEVEDGEVDDSKSGTVTVAAKPTDTAATSTEAKPSEPAAQTTDEPRKSEVLARRDQILREKEAARAAATLIPARPEVPRTFASDRNYNLPNRPEAPLPGRGQLDRHPSLRHGDRRDGRDSRLPEPGRLDQPRDRPPREYPANDRRGMEPNPRDFGRPSDRDRDRVRPEPPPRWTGESSRENQERAGPRGPDQSGRLSRDGGMPPPRISASDRGHPGGSEKLPPVSAERQELINPERAAIISGISTPPRSDSPRRNRDDARDRSRPQSPRRYATERDYQESRQDERSSRNGSADGYMSRTRQDDMQTPPAGPRSDRPADRTGERGGPDRSRDAFQPAQPPPRTIDPNHGRLNSSSRQQPDPNFGRLNAAPAPDIPSGPRDRNLRGNRIVSAPQTRRDGRPSDGPRPPTPPEASVPTGPSSTRSTRWPASSQVDASSTPSTPSTASAAGVHPDRLKHLGHAGAAVEPPSPSEIPAPGMHPDRLKAFANDSSSPGSQPSGNRSRPPMPPVVTQDPPSRPRGSHPSPVSAGGSGLPAPTGPASATERTMRGGRRQLAGINTMLQQAGQQNAPERFSVRGRGSRLAGEAQPFSGPPTPVGLPDGRQEPGYDLGNAPRVDLITGAAPGDPRDRGRRDRPTRHTRRDSRSPVGDRMRDSKWPGDDERDPGYREYRERKEGGRNDERQAGRDVGRDVVPGGRDERDRERDPPVRRGDIREREPHDGPWVGGERGPRGRDRELRGDDRRDSRGPRDDGSVGRKRRSDEGMADRGLEKRPRR